MRADLMTWVQRLVALVFGAGCVAIIAASAFLIARADGVPPLPVYAAVVGLAAMILLAGACLALISIAGSARRGADALQRLAAAGSRPPVIQDEAPRAQGRPFTTGQPAITLDEASATKRPGNRVLVAER